MEKSIMSAVNSYSWPSTELHLSAILWAEEILRDPDFIKDKAAYLANWRKERDGTEEFRLPEDVLSGIFHRHCRN